MALIVQKYGGTSLGSPERILEVSNRIAARVREGNELVVVVSAMGDSTDHLMELAKQISPYPPKREMDMLLTAGERISMALLSMALCKQGFNAVSFTGSQIGLITENWHGSARIKKVLGLRLREALDQKRIVIVAGFQGVSETKEVTTLGRGGSDTSAVAIAASLGVQACEIYTDVDGVYSANPRVIESAKHWSRLSLSSMLSLAANGAQVLHPRCVALGKRYGVRIWVRSSFEGGSLDRSEGTELVTEDQNESMEAEKIVGVTTDESRVLLRIELCRPTVASAVVHAGSERKVALYAPSFQGGVFLGFINETDSEDWKSILDQLSRDGFVLSYDIRSDIVPVAVVGECFPQDGLLLYRVLDAITDQEIAVEQGWSSDQTVIVAVPKARAEEAVRAVHRKWVE